jgi:hypothetical protein
VPASDGHLPALTCRRETAGRHRCSPPPCRERPPIPGRHSWTSAAAADSPPDVDLYVADGARGHCGPGDLLLVESQTAGTAATAGALLWRLGCRPVSLSNYCVGMALLRPSLPANQWNRELRRHFGWMPTS